MMEKRKLFRIVWKHEIYIQAKSPRLAKHKFDSLDLGNLKNEVNNKIGLCGHSLLSFEFVESLDLVGMETKKEKI